MDNDSNVISLAPDALIFINGKDSINVCNDCNCGLKLRDVITSFSVDLSINSSPGTASISLANPQHVDVPLIYKTESVFSAMQEVEIYIKSYFKHESSTSEYTYYPVFWGFISTVSETYSDGVYNATLSCKDILRWWEISRVNVNPAIDFTASWSTRTDNTIFHKIYSNMSISQIVYQVSKITVNELLRVNNLATRFSEPNGIEDYRGTNYQLMNYWKSRFLQISKNLRIFGYNGKLVEYSKELQEGLKKNFKNSEGWATFSNETPDVVDALGINGPEIDKLIPAGLETQTINGFQDQYESKLDIINNVKETVHYEFYMDTTGEIIFKPPFYNADVRDNPIHVINDLEIIDWNFTEDESAIVTRVEVGGNQFNQDTTDSTITAIWGYYVDYRLAEQYGLRVKQYTLNWLRTVDQCDIYAKSEISRLNALLKTGSITILGRPEARIGYPVYIASKDAFYYVTAVAHAFNFGGTYTTTLTLAGERKKIFNDNDEVEKDLALIFYDENTNQINSGITIVKELKQQSPLITNEEITTKLKSDSYSDLQIYKILNSVGEVKTFDFANSPNPLMRISDDCLGYTPTHFSTRTVNAMPFLGNQGKNYIYRNKKLTFNNIIDYTKGHQITDSEGYSLIGIFPYGKDLKILPSSTIGTKSLIEVEKTASRLASQAFNVKPNSEVKNSVIENGVIPTMDNGGSQLVKDNPVNMNALAYGITLRSIDMTCNCGCHNKYKLKLTQLPRLTDYPRLNASGTNSVDDSSINKIGYTAKNATPSNVGPLISKITTKEKLDRLRETELNRKVFNRLGGSLQIGSKELAKAERDRQAELAKKAGFQTGGSK